METSSPATCVRRAAEEGRGVGGREGRSQQAGVRQPNLKFPQGTGNPNSDASFGA